MKITVKLNKKDLVALILSEIQEKTKNYSLKESDIVIEVKSNQNYKSEWESADFRATYDGEV